MLRGWVLLALGCSRPSPIIADPVTAPIPVDAAPPADKYFMDTSDGSSDCYRDVHCKPTGPKCEGKLFDAKWTAKVRAESGDAWCCSSSMMCEFPKEK